jgi:hypothetical protein
LPRGFLGLVRIAERGDVVGGVVIRNELQRVGDAPDEIFLCNRRHEDLPVRGPSVTAVADHATHMRPLRQDAVDGRDRHRGQQERDVNRRQNSVV